MKETDFDVAYEKFELDDEYGDFLLDHQDGQRLICNGDDLIRAIEEEYRFDEFKEYMVNSK